MSSRDEPAIRDGELIPIEEFDRLARAGEFADGPWISNFGDGRLVRSVKEPILRPIVYAGDEKP